jgi:hypothetical protein
VVELLLDIFVFQQGRDSKLLHLPEELAEDPPGVGEALHFCS